MKIGDNHTYMKVDLKGGGLKELVIQDEEILKPSTDFINTHGGMAILAPFANRIRKGKYTFLDRSYQLKVNSEGNAIHGFARDSSFNVTKRNESMCRIQTDLTGPGYPWTVRLSINYTLYGNGFKCSTSAQNLSSDPAPFQIGFHPYFTFHDYWILASDKPGALLNYKDQYFPDGTANILDPFQISSIDQNALDNTFLTSGGVLFTSGKSRITIDREGLDYLVLYNGIYSGGVSVAIEPMSAPPDAFNNGMGLVILMPNTVYKTSFRVSLKDYEAKDNSL